MATIVVSDSAQYDTGRALGRHKLAPAISPNKTVEGAIGGLVFGTAAMTCGGLEVFKGVNVWLLGGHVGRASSCLAWSAICSSRY